MAEQKAAGQKVSIPAAPKRGKVIDLMSALKGFLARQKTNAATDRKDNLENAAPDQADRVDRAQRSSTSRQSRGHARSKRIAGRPPQTIKS